MAKTPPPAPKNTATVDEKGHESHPSFGMVGLSRTMNGTRATPLFGSALEDHHGTLRLVVRRAIRRRDLSRDWYHARDELIDLEMSAAQFLEFITNPNVGSGVPCTLRYVRNGQLERMPDVPNEPTEAENIRQTFTDRIAEYVDRMRAGRAEIDKITATLSAKARERLRVQLDVMVDQLASNVPFIVSQFQEASGRVVSAAKHEVEAFVSTVLRSAGLEAIAEGRFPKALAAPVPSAEDEERVWRDAGCPTPPTCTFCSGFHVACRLDVNGRWYCPRCTGFHTDAPRVLPAGTEAT